MSSFIVANTPDDDVSEVVGAFREPSCGRDLHALAGAGGILFGKALVDSLAGGDVGEHHVVSVPGNQIDRDSLLGGPGLVEDIVPATLDEYGCCLDCAFLQFASRDRPISVSGWALCPTPCGTRDAGDPSSRKGESEIDVESDRRGQFSKSFPTFDPNIVEKSFRKVSRTLRWWRALCVTDVTEDGAGGSGRKGRPWRTLERRMDASDSFWRPVVRRSTTSCNSRRICGCSVLDDRFSSQGLPQAGQGISCSLASFGSMRGNRCERWH